MSTQPISLTTMRQQFKHPPPEYGLYPCWWWEGEPITKEKLTWTLEQMKQVGTYATFFYLRSAEDNPFALVPAFGSNEFYELFKYSLEEHRRLDMKAYFSEWSGANSIESQIKADPESYNALKGNRLAIYEGRSQSAQPVTLTFPADEQLLTAVAYKGIPGGLDEDTRQDLSDLVDQGQLAWDAPEAGWYVAVVTSQPHGLDWMNQSVSQFWVERLWRPFLEKMPQFIGNTFAGYIQDEVNVLAGDALYSPQLLATFITEKGYDPRPDLIGLFHDIGPRTEKVRCDYYGVMSQLLEQNVYAYLYRWHHQLNMEYGTIAIRARQDLLGETDHFGDLFSLMRWYDFPGNEDPHVSERIPVTRRFIDAKLSSSAAHIFGRNRAAVCAYWGSGWGLTMEQNVAWTNENYAYGLNLFDPHLCSQSMGGSWFEWVPPSNFLYQPYLDHYKAFSDYVTRLSFVLRQGVHVGDVALVFPTTSVHANWLGASRFNLEADLTACTTYNMAESLYRGGVDFDFMDEQTIGTAQVQNGKLCVEGLAFPAVVLPPITTVRLETMRKIKQLYDDGGLVVAFQRLPYASAESGRGDPELRSILQHLFGIESSDDHIHEAWTPDSKTGDTDENHFARSLRYQRNARGGTAFFVPGEQNRGMNAATVELYMVINSSLTPDVSNSDGDIYHLHKKVGDTDIYFLFNRRPEATHRTLTLRATGQCEVWDAFTGKIGPYFRVEDCGSTSKVRLHLEKNQAVLLVFTPGAGRPNVVEDNLTEILSVQPNEQAVQVDGLCATGGRKTVHVQYLGRRFVAEQRVLPPPPPISLDGDWQCELKPTMDNRWGDFRYPASPTRLGAEARQFKYAEEGDVPGEQLNWHQANFDDAGWLKYSSSYGPYWYNLTLPETDTRADFVKTILAEGVDLKQAYEGHRWRRYDYSQLFGHESKKVHRDFGGLRGVSDHFLVFDAQSDGADTAQYLYTIVHAPCEGHWDLVIGGEGQFPRHVWINGDQVLADDTVEAEVEDSGPRLPSFQQGPPPFTTSNAVESRISVRLKEGPNQVLIKIVQSKGRTVWAHATLLPPGTTPEHGRPPIPRLKWFLEPTDLTYDILPDSAQRVGWYRFEAPAGMRAMTLSVNALNVTAWVDGWSVPLRHGRIELDEAQREISQVALRLEQKPGCYGGAALPEPVQFDCERGTIELGDWCEHALESYSGGVVYSKSFNLEPRHLEGNVVIDLGKVNITAEVRINGNTVGVCLARPNCLDITEHVREGENKAEVTVCNTLANHYSVGIPSGFVYDGQTESGLLGPVRIEFLRPATFHACSDVARASRP